MSPEISSTRRQSFSPQITENVAPEVLNSLHADTSSPMPSDPRNPIWVRSSCTQGAERISGRTSTSRRTPAVDRSNSPAGDTTIAPYSFRTSTLKSAGPVKTTSRVDIYHLPVVFSRLLINLKMRCAPWTVSFGAIPLGSASAHGWPCCSLMPHLASDPRLHGQSTGARSLQASAPESLARTEGRRQWRRPRARHIAKTCPPCPRDLSSGESSRR